MSSLDRYGEVVGQDIVEAIYKEAKPLQGKELVHINSTTHGGGVAEILNSLIPLFKDAGMEPRWEVIKGRESFFGLTKQFHNALQGARIDPSFLKRHIYLTVNKQNAQMINLDDADFVVVHDSQPLPLITFYKKKQPWVWRFHPDLTKPNPVLWNYLTQFIKLYDVMVVTMEQYKKGVIPEVIIQPSIDPFTVKNKPLEEEVMERVLAEHGIPLDKPFVAQVSRFDPWKDPLGVIAAFKVVKRKFDCRLVLVGNFATDDPEGPRVYNEVVRKAEHDDDIILVLNSPDNDRLVNSVQTKAHIIIQKSIREGFALTVSEALWKGTPVVGGNVGGIPAQIVHGRNGFLVDSVQECAAAVLKLLRDPKKAKEMGKAGREYVRKHFLMTRHLRDYLRLMKRLSERQRVI